MMALNKNWGGGEGEGRRSRPRFGDSIRVMVTLVASCLRGDFPPVDLRAVCLVRAMLREIQLLTPCEVIIVAKTEKLVNNLEN